jgi:ubiquinone/menaquinone biosynthesis C-methylase UbiE
LVLSHPAIFEWQQKTCNSYDNVKDHYAKYLSAGTKKILDVGCSTGAAAAGTIDMSKHDYTGVDIDPTYVEFAQKRYPAGKFMAMDARHMAFPDDSFDICMFNGVLHHMDDDLSKAIFLDLKRVLKPDGVILVSEPVFTPGKWLSNFLLSLDRGKYIRPVDGYRQLFAGLNVVEESFFPFSLHRFCSFVLKK